MRPIVVLLLFPLFCGHFGFLGLLEPKTTISPFQPPQWSFAHSKNTTCQRDNVHHVPRLTPNLTSNQRVRVRVRGPRGGGFGFGFRFDFFWGGGVRVRVRVRVQPGFLMIMSNFGKHQQQALPSKASIAQVPLKIVPRTSARACTPPRVSWMPYLMAILRNSRPLSTAHDHLSRNHCGHSFLPALLQKLVGEVFLIFCREIWREICRIFSHPQNKGSKNSGNISEHLL